MSSDPTISASEAKILTEEEREKLEYQNTRLVPDFKANQLEINARKHWDLFYKRNDTRFFRDRHWTIREFNELLGTTTKNGCADKNNDDKKLRKRLLEVGCGVGNFVFPLIEEKHNGYFIYACDFSQRAVDLVKAHPLYDEDQIQVFQCDITTDTIFETIARSSLDIVSLVFVLSAIHPNKFKTTLLNIFQLLRPGGILLFRDYGLYDMAQIRFKPGHKISENFYMRQDGTR